MQISYNFTDEEKAQMLSIVENEAIEEMLKLNGKSVFFKEEAIYLAKRVVQFNSKLARRILNHPGLKETDQ